MLKILTGQDNKILRKKSLPVQKTDKRLFSLIDKMVECMQREEGVGLAAPQVGENIRVIVVKIFKPDGKQYSIAEMINPEIVQHSKEEAIDIEGCLSCPGQLGKVKRFVSLKVRYKNKKNVQLIIHLSDMNARIIQHEIDHLDGILFIDKALEIVEQTDEEKQGSL